MTNLIEGNLRSSSRHRSNKYFQALMELERRLLLSTFNFPTPNSPSFGDSFILAWDSDLNQLDVVQDPLPHTPPEWIQIPYEDSGTPRQVYSDVYIKGTADNETLTTDFSNGTYSTLFGPPGNQILFNPTIQFNDSGTLNNTLIIVGASGASVSLTGSNITYTDPTGSTTIEYGTGVAHIELELTDGSNVTVDGGASFTWYGTTLPTSAQVGTVSLTVQDTTVGNHSNISMAVLRRYLKT